MNQWTNAEHARAYLERADTIPHRAEGERVLLDHVPREARRILDIGTGDGWLLALLKADRPEMEGIALDFSPTMLRAARRRFARMHRSTSLSTASDVRCRTWRRSKRWCRASPSITSRTSGSGRSTQRCSVG